MSMNRIFEEIEAEMLKQFRAITSEQLAEDDRRRKAQREYEAQHTAIETDADRGDPEKYPEESEDE